MKKLHGLCLLVLLSILTACSNVVSAASNNSQNGEPSGHYLLIGGEAIPEGCALGDSWRFDGKDWTTAVTLREVIPPARTRSQVVMAYEPNGSMHRLVLFGGQDGCQYLNDTWEYRNGSWSQVNTPQSPSPRAGSGMSYDIARQVVVLFGGYSGAESNRPDQAFTDTWEFDGATWRQVPTPHTPPPSIGVAMAYDASRQKTVLFTGQQNSGYDWRNQTWEYDGRDWVLASNDPLGGVWRHSPSMAYDPSRERIVLFGGYHQGGARPMLDDTWEYDGARWHLAQAQGGPKGRCRASMLYDPIRQRLVMFGGAADGGLLPDMWQLDGTQWTEILPATYPTARAFGSLVLLP